MSSMEGRAAAGLADDLEGRGEALAAALAEGAAEREARGGTPLAERARIRESGLLTLMVPRHLGGLGGTWPVFMRIVRRLAAADASLAHLFGYHHLEVVTPHLIGTPAQRDHFYAATAREGWFWGNALNPLDRRVTLSTRDGTLRLDGLKSFCTGARDSDVLLVSAVHPDSPQLAVAVIPTRRAGVQVNDDWDNMGQRLTDSGSVRFEDVEVRPEELLGPPGAGGSTFATLRSCVTQLILTNIFLGIAQGALDEARRYTRERGRPWLTSGVQSAGEDPFVLRHFGEMWVQVEGARTLAESAATTLQCAWEQEDALTPAGRGEAAVAVATAKVLCSTASLEVATRVFEAMGASATSGRYGFDRFWRNARTLTLHDPLDYKLRDVGAWVLNGTFPPPTFYS